MVELVDLIKDRLTFVWRDAKQNTPKDPSKIPPQVIMSYFSQKGSFSLARDGVMAIRKTIADIRKLKTAAHFSDRYLEDAIYEAVTELLPTKETEILAAAKKQADAILRILTTVPVDWIVLVPIMDMYMEMDDVRIGRVHFHNGDYSDIGKLQSGILAIIEAQRKESHSTVSGDDLAQFLPNFKKPLEELFAKHVIAEVNVSAADSERAKEIAIHSLGSTLDTLYFFTLDHHLNEPFTRNQGHFDVQGDIWQDSLNMLLFSEKKSVFARGRKNAFMPFRLTETVLGYMKANGLAMLNDILERDLQIRTSFEKDMITAIRFCALAVRDRQLANAFVNSVISLEALLMDEHEQISDNLSERVAFILGQNLDERNGYFDEMKRLYNIRSAIVHYGNTDMQSSDFSLLCRVITYRCITRLLNSYKSLKIESKKDLIMWIRKQKFT